MRALLAFLILGVFLIGACGGGGGLAGGPADSALTLEQELAALTLPPGVDPVLWESLKSELRSAVNAGTAVHHGSLAPDSASSRVDDLQFAATGAGSGLLNWTYRNQGDYNQDKLVNASDLTMVGIYYNSKTGDADWNAASLADGNSDGMITASDISPLGAYFLRRVGGYRVYADAGGATPIRDVAFAEGGIPPGQFRYRFQIELEDLTDGVEYTVQPFDGDSLGPLSNPAQFSADSPQVTVTVPDGMMALEEAQWEAGWTGGTAPFNIIWEFGGGSADFGRAYAVSPNRQTVVMANPNPTEPTVFTYQVTVTDSRGLSGLATGEYSVAVNPTPQVTVTVPKAMAGDDRARWWGWWTGGTAPYTVLWEMGGGAADQTGGVCEDEPACLYDALMINPSLTDPATYAYTLTVTDANGIAGSATGTYSVGANLHPQVTVTVPPQVNGDEQATWRVDWIGGVGPYTVSWEFGGGAEDLLPAETVSPAVITRAMINYDMLQPTDYTYTVTVEDSAGHQGLASGQYIVGPGPNQPPQIVTAGFSSIDQVLTVAAQDLNPDETLYITVTEPAGFHVDATGKQASATGPLSAAFNWTVDPPGSGVWGASTITVADSHGATTSRDVVLLMPAPDTLYAVPMQAAVAVNEPVDIVLVSGATSWPFNLLCMASITVEPGAEFSAESVNIGAIGGAVKQLDGIWALMDPAPVSFFMQELFMFGPVDNGDGLERFEISLIPGTGSDLTGQAGELVNFRMHFTQPGTYHLRLVDFGGGVNRTYYEDLDEYGHTWSDISNVHAGLATSITVE